MASDFLASASSSSSSSGTPIDNRDLPGMVQFSMATLLSSSTCIAGAVAVASRDVVVTVLDQESQTLGDVLAGTAVLPNEHPTA